MKTQFPIFVFALAGSFFTGVASAAEPADFDHAVRPFLQQYCMRCHDAKEQGGEFRLDSLTKDFVDRAASQRWSEVITRMNAGEMPPEDEAQPTPDELGKVVDWISVQIAKGEAARMAKRGPVSHYRLSREEYANTVYDLLGVHYDVNLPGTFNEDPLWHGFERIGSMLSLSPSHVDRYFEAAETVLERAFPPKQPKSAIKHRDSNTGHEKQLDELGIEGRVRWLVWPGSAVGAGGVKEAGTYRLRIQLSGLQPLKGRAPHLSIYSPQANRSIFDEDIIAPENAPIAIELEAQLSPGESLALRNDTPGPTNEGHTISGNRKSLFISTSETSLMIPWGRKMFDEQGNALYPLLIVDSIEMEGPLLSDDILQKRAGLIPTESEELAEARTCLHRLADRAWRRPATDVEIDRYVKIMESEIAAGEKFRTAYMTAMTGILTSKNFYYLQEGSADQRRDLLNDWELASRLSYFLWGSMPDEALFDAAGSGKLHESDVLQTQLTRMLSDQRIERFTRAFPQQWLQLHRVGMFPPDKKLYPEYDSWLERSMILETQAYFNEVFTKNLSLREFLASDWTMLNPRLALHYGFPSPDKSGFHRVSLKPEDHRGGLLTQASILSLTSDGTRHRPVHRGVWVSESIFGKTPPPPPPNVEPLEESTAKKDLATIRAKIEDHATNANCASCHRRIDPLGFAFENYDAIGRWRTEETATKGKKQVAVNAHGTLPDGRAFGGPEEFKKLLVEDEDAFAKTFVESLATFALRRVMTVDDADEIEAITDACQKDNYQLRTVIETFVLSDLFQQR